MLNWRALGEPEKSAASKNWFYASIGMLLVAVLLVAWMNDAADSPVRLMGVAFLLAWYFASGRQQSKYVKAKFGEDYLRQPWSKPLVIGVGGLVVYPTVVFVVEFLFGFANGFLHAVS